MSDCFPSKQTKEPHFRGGESDRSSAENGKDEPIPRAARAWQELQTNTGK